MVRRPALYELNEKEDLREVLELAGGVLASADLKEIRVERVVAHERHTMLRVQIPDGEFSPLPIAIPNFVAGTPADNDVAIGVTRSIIQSEAGAHGTQMSKTARRDCPRLSTCIS